MCVRWLWRCLLFLPAVDSKGDETCWMDGVTWEQCCAAKFGPEGNGACWGGDFTFERCCIDAEPAEVPPELAAASATSYPACWHPGVVLRHAGENGIFADLSLYGHTGCFLNNCKLTDKFAAVDAGVCSRACSEVEECSHWTFGQQYGVKTCFLRKSDAGRAFLPHWISGTSDCAPPRLPPAWVALRTAKCEGLRACDAGKGGSSNHHLAVCNRPYETCFFRSSGSRHLVAHRAHRQRICKFPSWAALGVPSK
ncbi:unnamed protein product [Symbiodinium sp. KB8]|nr:unnamed protein product [Symbiodinium sp. KB8]